MIIRSAIALTLAALLAGCSSFKLGTMLYVPNGQTATMSVGPAASAPK
jgi:hypothetical protein